MYPLTFSYENNPDKNKDCGEKKKHKSPGYKAKKNRSEYQKNYRNRTPAIIIPFSHPAASFGFVLQFIQKREMCYILMNF